MVLRVKSGAKPGEDFLSFVQWERKNNDEMHAQTTKKDMRGHRFIYKGQKPMPLPATGKSQIHYKAQILKYFDREFRYSFDICLPAGRQGL